MSSLAKQLERLALPHTQTVLGEDKRRPSLLFSPKDAANLDRDAVFALGVTGLEELINMDANFTQYEHTLFSASSTNWERSIQTKQVNDKLDETIEEFLIQLSPYFLLKSAHKTLEWLIYRYHIHQYNGDILLLSVFPYHESRMFIRVLQLLPGLSDPGSKWHWMYNCSKNGSPLVKKTLYQHCTSDPGFLALLCDLLPKFIKVHGSESSQLRTMLSLYTCTVLAVLQHGAGVTERLIGLLVPHLTRGLKSRCRGYQAATYMLVAQMCSVVKVQDKLTNTLLPLLVKKIRVNLIPEALSCLAIVYHTQGLTEIKNKSLKHLLRLPAIIIHLRDLSTTSPAFAASFLRPLVSQLVVMAMKKGDGGVASASSGDSDGEATMSGPINYVETLTAILRDIHMEKELADYVASDVVRGLVSGYGKLSTSRKAEGWKEMATSLIRILERRCSPSLTLALESQHQEAGCANIVQQLTKIAALPMQYQIMGDSTSLLLAVNHADSAVRCIAMTHLINSLKAGTAPVDQFVTDAVIGRLQDDDRQVVLTVLELNQKLLDVIAPKQLAEILLGLFRKHVTVVKWKKVLMAAASLLTSPAMLNAVPSVSTQMLPYLLKPSCLREHLMGDECKELSKHPLYPQDSQDNTVMIASMAQRLIEAEADTYNGLVTDLVGLYGACPYSSTCVLLLLSEVISVHSNPSTHLASLELTAPLLGLLTKALNSETLKSGNGSVQGDPPTILEHKSFKTAGTQRVKGVSDMKFDYDTVSPETYSRQHQSAAVQKFLADRGVVEKDMMHHTMTAIRHGKLADATLSHVAETIADCLATHKMPEECNCQHWMSVTEPLLAAGLALWKLLVSQAIHNKRQQEKWRTLLNTFSQGELFLWLLPHLWTGAGDACCQVASYHSASKLWQQCDQADSVIQQNPYVLLTLLHSLSSPHAIVRGAASECVKHLYKASKSSTHAAILKRLSKRHEELHADPAYVAQALGFVFRDAKDKEDATPTKATPSKKAKEAKNIEQSLKEFVGGIVNESVPDTVMEGLLALCVHIPPKKMFPLVEPVATRLLTKTSFSSVNLSSLGHILHFLEDQPIAALDSLELCLLTSAVTSDLSVASVVGEQGFVAVIGMDVITKALFHSCSKPVQKQLVTVLLDTGLKSTQPKVTAGVKKTLKQIKFHGSHILHEIQDTSQPKEVTVKAAKRARRHEAQKALNLDRLQPLLEVMQGRKSIKDADSLILALFDLLSRLLNCEHTGREYCKQLVLSALQVLSETWQPDTSQQVSLPVEVLVQCIRHKASSVVTQQHALLVMAQVAHLFPDYILHNVMSLFTFVGSSGLVQQDDEHSINVISTAVSTLIPALIQAHSTKLDTKSNAATTSSLKVQIRDIMRVFVDARQHMSRQRSVPLFQQVAAVVGVRDYLWLLQAVLMESSVRSKVNVDEGDAEGSSGVDKDVELLLLVCDEFEAADQLHALSNLLLFLSELVPLHAQGCQNVKKAGGGLVKLVCSQTMTPPQLRLLHFHTTRIVAVFLASDAFVDMVTRQQPMPDALAAEFETFIKECLCYLSLVMRCHGNNSNTTTAKFWKALLSKVYEILEKVNALLPTSVFLNVVSELMKHESIAVRKKALDLLITRLQAIQINNLEEQDISSLLALVDELSLVAGQQHHESGDVSDIDWQISRQLSLYSIKLLAKLLAQTHQKTFVKLLTLSIDVLREGFSSIAVLSSGLLCAAELITGLGAHAIASLPTLMPALMDVAENIPQSSGEVLLVCVLTLVQRVVSALPLFLSPYLPRLLSALCCLPATPPDTPATARWKAVSSQISSAVFPRVLVPVLAKCHDEVLNTKPECVSRVVQLAEQHISQMRKEDLAAHHHQLITLLCKAMDFRNNAPQQTSASTLHTCEDAALSAVLSMVVRLSESAFRPMFFSLCDWACRQQTSSITANRKLVFYQLCHRLSQRLKSLFNLFVGHVLKVMIETLEACNTMKQADSGDYGPEITADILDHILGCLYNCMLHDSDGGLVTNDVFTLLMQPLLDQLENECGGEAVYQRRVSEAVVPAICQLAVTVMDDSSMLKTLNYQLCLKTRHTQPKVRFACLHVISGVAEKLGDEYMSLLPETIPFLAELMEDEVEEVEQECQRVVSVLEELLNEPLQKYF